MTVPLFLQSSQPNYCALMILYIAIIMNDYIIRSRWVQKKIDQYLLMELFYISGHCQNSGYCCNHLQLEFNGKPIVTDHELQSLQKKDPKYLRFYSPLKETKKLTYLSCHCLENKQCNDYINRPQVCRKYPVNRFLKEGVIRQGCGYHVKKKQNLPQFNNKIIKSMISRVEILNNII